MKVKKVNMTEVAKSIVFFMIFAYQTFIKSNITSQDGQIAYIIFYFVMGYFFINSMGNTIEYSDTTEKTK